jgi:zinc protease
MPDKNSPEYYAMGLLDQILIQGQDSRLYQALVQEKGYSGSVDGGINSGLGNMFNYNGPMLWDGNLVYDNNVSADSIIAVVDREIKKLETQGINQQMLDLALVKMRSSFYDQISQLYGFGKADLLASFALFDNDPNRINKLESEFKKVTPALIQKTIREYLRPTNRTILTINPQAKS